MAIAVILTIVCVVLLLAANEEMIMRREERRLKADRERRKRRAAMEERLYTEQDLRAWTPQEREALGVNDTIALISRIDKELGVDYAEAKITPGEHVYMSKNTHITQEAS